MVVDSEAASIAKPSRPAQASQQTLTKSAPDAANAAAAQPEAAARKTDTANPNPGKKTLSADEQPQAKAADQTDDLLNPTEEELRGIARPGGAAVRGYTAYAGPDGGKETLSANEQPRAVNAGIKDVAKVAQAEGAVRKPGTANPNPGKKTLSADEQPQTKAADQTDDLLNPTEEAAPIKNAEKAAQPEGAARKTDAASAKPDGGAAETASSKQSSSDSAADRALPDASAPAVSDTAAAEPQTRVAPVISIESDVDAESWAEYGGWYRQDYAIFYRPIGHKDKFIHSWLLLTGPQAPKGDRSPAAAVFDLLTHKDAQGSCTKCHSVDDIRGKGRLVNFSPPSVKSKQGRFTNFIHEPHFGLLENCGCLTCHELEKGRPYLQSYEQGNPRDFVSNFAAVKKDLCQTCHTSNMARQDCLLCHKYHVNGVITPIMNTRTPTE